MPRKPMVYKDLRRRIEDYGFLITELPELLGCSFSHTSAALCGHARFSAAEMETLAGLLCIPQEDMGRFFFPNVPKMEAKPNA